MAPKLTDLFNSLDTANTDLATAKADYDAKEAIAADAYTTYGEKLKVANDLRAQVADALGNAFPSTLPSRVRVN